MRRPSLATLAVLACAGCAGGDAQRTVAANPATTTHGARASRPAQPPPAAIVGTPDVRFGSSGGERWWLLVSVRLDRALPADVHAALAVPGARAGGERAEAVPGLRHCYQQYLHAEGAPPTRGRVSVRLNVAGGGPRTDAAVGEAARQEPAPTGAREHVEIARAAGCGRRPGDHVCDGVAGGSPMTIAVERAQGYATCATARRVLRAVGRWADSRCFDDLCASEHRMNRGFRCTVAKVGEADWEITCRRGRQVVRGSTAD